MAVNKMGKTRAARIASLNAKSSQTPGNTGASHESQNSAMPATARDGKPLPTDLDYHSFVSSADFEAFMEEHHSTSPGFYLKTAKKSSGVTSIDLPEATVVALCFGWIDGWGKGIDDIWRFIRFTPRRSKSIWSQKNVSTVEKLEQEGRMRPAGIAAVDAAKADGRWDRAYAGPATMKTPIDVQAALDSLPAARAIFDAMSRSQQYALLIKVETASPKARPGRIQALLQQLQAGVLTSKQAVGPSKATTVRKAAGKTKK